DPARARGQPLEARLAPLVEGPGALAPVGERQHVALARQRLTRRVARRELEPGRRAAGRGRRGRRLLGRAPREADAATPRREVVRAGLAAPVEGAAPGAAVGQVELERLVG